MREIIFDTETTGLDPEQGDRVIEIGCIELMDLIPTGQTFHAYFNPNRSVHPKAVEVHGLTNAFLANQPLFEDKVEGLLDFIGDAIMVAHNADFDWRFLNAELRRLKRPPLAWERMVDTLTMARNQMPGARNDLDSLCNRFNIDRSGRIKHGALLDCELLAQVYLELRGGRQSSLGLGQAAGAVVSEGEGRPSSLPTPRTFYPVRSHAPRAQELAAHQTFVAGIKNALWGQYET